MAPLEKGSVLGMGVLSQGVDFYGIMA